MTKIPPRRLILAAAVIGASFVASAQDAPVPSPAPVEVRVRVTAAGRFLDDLKLEEFGILEDGRTHSPVSLILVKDGAVVRRGGPDAAPGRRTRSYTLLFQAVDWDPKLEEAIQYLFRSVLKPGDRLTLVTPVKPYQLQKDALIAKSQAELSKGMGETVRRDIVRGGGEYRGIINDLKRLTRAIGGGSSTFDEDLESDSSTESDTFGLEMQIDRYRQALMKMDGIRLVDEAKLLVFAAALKAQAGQKTVVLFYQREYRPEISATAMNNLMSSYQDRPDILGSLMDLFQFYKREKAFDADRVKKAFADAGIDFHFIFMEKKNQRIFGATMREQSEDTYPGFVEIARATGGTAESASNPAASFKHAADSSAEYYLLSYVPEKTAAPADFRQIDVRVKRAGCQVSSPLGFYAK